MRVLTNTKNKWEDVAKIFNLRLFEKFDLSTDKKAKFYFTELGLKRISLIGAIGEVKQAEYDLLREMLNGYADITLPLYVPKHGDTYWYIDSSSTATEKAVWDGHFIDKRNFKLGNCFRTKEEADQKTKELNDGLDNYYDDFYKAVFVQREQEN